MKNAFARIEGRSLLVYLGGGGPSDKKSKNGKRKLVRALPLDGAVIEAVEKPPKSRRSRKKKYFEFEVRPRRMAFAPCRLRASSADSRDEWIRHLAAEASRAPRVPPDEEAPPVRQRLTSSIDELDPRAATTSVDDDALSEAPSEKQPIAALDEFFERSGMDAVAKRRYEFFEAERDFADDLAAVAERLRQLPRRDRQMNLPRMLRQIQIPRLAYLPLCYSTDTWRTVLSVVTDEGSVFNTKERCPCLLFFETAHERGLDGVDVANVIHAHIAGDDDVPEKEDELEEDEPKLREVASAKELREDADKTKERSRSEPPGLPRKRPQSIWRPETVTVSPLVKDDEEKDEIDFDETDVSDTDEEIEEEPKTPQEQKTEQNVPRTGSRLSEQAERIHARASRVLEFWRSQMQQAQHWVEQAVPAPQSVRRHWSVDETDDDAGNFKRAAYGEGFGAKEAKIRARSVAAKVEPSWALRAVIVKSNDDLRQEVFVVQLISRYARLFASRKLPLYLRPYRIVALSASTGMIELVPDAISLDKLFSKPDYPGSLKKHFIESYGEEGSLDFETARTNFIHSAAAAAFVCYALALKDRHNGNILLDTRGRLVHIDFGFVLGFATGGSFSLEQWAPFKFTKNMLDLIGDINRFIDAFANALIAARDILDEVATLIEIMQFKSSFPCFTQANLHVNAAQQFRDRHFPHLDDTQLRAKAAVLVHQALDNKGTYLYDVFQKKTNGIAY